MTQQLTRWLWISFFCICLLLFANRSFAHNNNFPNIKNSQLDSKVANLEISLRQLQREVGLLKSQLPIQRSPQASQIPIPQRPSSLSSDPQLQNLANLVIELKQDIRNLETRLEQLDR